MAYQLKAIININASKSNINSGNENNGGGWRRISRKKSNGVVKRRRRSWRPKALKIMQNNLARWRNGVMAYNEIISAESGISISGNTSENGLNGGEWHQ